MLKFIDHADIKVLLEISRCMELCLHVTCIKKLSVKPGNEVTARADQEGQRGSAGTTPTGAGTG